tara:strand:- start:210 stop:605 length:396 start_codon:yes stop_codon:yes gene_type:complete
MSHSIPVRIYYEDTDAGGVVYHASYIRFAERGRTEYLRHIGFENTQIYKDFDVLFVVRHLEADYLAPSFLDDYLTLTTEVSTMKNTSFIMTHRLENDEKSIFKMKVVVACIGKDKRPVKIPEVLRNALQDL